MRLLTRRMYTFCAPCASRSRRAERRGLSSSTPQVYSWQPRLARPEGRGSAHGHPRETMKDTLGVLLAGGAGERLFPLTRDRAKPAVPFGGNYRIIDITMSNCINSGLRKVYILTQYKALSLNRHIREGWTGIVAQEL